MTLIEVMLAVVILGIGAGVLMLATARCMSVVLKAQHYSNAHRLIQRVSSEKPIARNADDIQDGIETGSFGDGYTWEREITESENEDRQGLYTVRTRVSWSMHGKNTFEEVTTLIYIQPDEEDRNTPRGSAL